MPITINGSGTVTGISAGGLPDSCITTADIAANAVTAAKLGSAEQSGLCKAFVNFNGTGVVAIRANYNVSSITDNGAGAYAVNFATAMVDANYAAIAGVQGPAGYNTVGVALNNTNSSSLSLSVVGIIGTNNVATDTVQANVAIFR
jgi:hypothetical protein